MFTISHGALYVWSGGYMGGSNGFALIPAILKSGADVLASFKTPSGTRLGGFLFA